MKTANSYEVFGRTARALEDVKLALKERVRIKPSIIPDAYKDVRELFMRCFKSFQYTDEDYFYKKGRLKLGQEMDIRHYIREMRHTRNSMKHMTTKAERRLVQMQADKNVIFLKEDEKEKLEDSPWEMTTQEI